VGGFPAEFGEVVRVFGRIQLKPTFGLSLWPDTKRDPVFQPVLSSSLFLCRRPVYIVVNLLYLMLFLVVFVYCMCQCRYVVVLNVVCRSAVVLNVVCRFALFLLIWFQDDLLCRIICAYQSVWKKNIIQRVDNDWRLVLVMDSPERGRSYVNMKPT
jgi:hypothetical protein